MLFQNPGNLRHCCGIVLESFDECHGFSLPSLCIQSDPDGFAFSIMPAFVGFGQKLLPFRVTQKLPEIRKR